MTEPKSEISPETGLSTIITEAIRVINTARKHKKSITNGSNFYVIKFSELRTKSIIALETLENHFSENRELKPVITSIRSSVESFFDTNTSNPDRSKIGKKILSDFRTLIVPSFKSVIIHEPTDKLFPFELVKGSRGYIERIAIQALGCYDLGWYDACAVMIRRLLETLIIECFETHKIEYKIKNQDDNFLYLQDLISKFLNDSEGKWNVSRNTKNSIPNLKDIGDKSAHNRYFTARQSDIDAMRSDLRTVIEELISISSPRN